MSRSTGWSDSSSMTGESRGGDERASILLFGRDRDEALRMSDALGELGCSCSCVATPAELEIVLAGERVDLAVVDDGGNIEEGLAICRAIGAVDLAANPAVLLLATMTGPAEVLNAMVAGAAGVMPRPVDLELLTSRIQHQLANDEIRRSQGPEDAVRVLLDGDVLPVQLDPPRLLDALLAMTDLALRRGRESESLRTAVSAAEERRRHAEQRFEQYLEASREGAVILGSDSSVRFANAAALSLLGTTGSELSGTSLPFALDDTGEGRVTMGDGASKIVLAYRSSETRWRGEVASLVTMCDESARSSLRQRIEQLGMNEELTGLFNREGFLSVCRHQLDLAQRQGIEMLLTLVNLQKLDEVNRRLGHAMGDLMVVDLAAILRATFRDSDVLARMGEDQFAVLATDATDKAYEAISRRLAANLERHNETEGRGFLLEVDLVRAKYEPRRDESIASLVERATGMLGEPTTFPRGGRP